MDKKDYSMLFPLVVLAAPSVALLYLGAWETALIMMVLAVVGQVFMGAYYVGSKIEEGHD